MADTHAAPAGHGPAGATHAAQSGLGSTGNSLDLEIVTPEGRKLHEPVTSLTAPGAKGELGILPGHIAILVEGRVSGPETRLDRPRHRRAQLHAHQGWTARRTSGRP